MGISEEDISEMMNTVMKAVNSTNSYDFEVVAEAINKEYQKAGYDAQIEVSQAEDMMEYLELANQDFEGTLDKLVTDEMISEAQADYILRFNTDLEKVADEGISKFIIDFKQEVQNDKKLIVEEKVALDNYLTVVKAGIESVSLDKSPCTDCIKRNKRDIFGWGSVVILTVILVGCTAATGPLFWACVVGVAGLIYAGGICTECGNQCGC
jgi:hypothetical protein